MLWERFKLPYRAHDVHLQSLGDWLLILHTLDRELRIVQVALLEDARAGDGMVYPAMLIVSLLEEIVDVAVSRHVTLGEACS